LASKSDLQRNRGARNYGPNELASDPQGLQHLRRLRAPARERHDALGPQRPRPRSPTSTPPTPSALPTSPKPSSTAPLTATTGLDKSKFQPGCLRHVTLWVSPSGLFGEGDDDGIDHAGDRGRKSCQPPRDRKGLIPHRFRRNIFRGPHADFGEARYPTIDSSRVPAGRWDQDYT